VRPGAKRDDSGADEANPRENAADAGSAGGVRHTPSAKHDCSPPRLSAPGTVVAHVDAPVVHASPAPLTGGSGRGLRRFPEQGTDAKGVQGNMQSGSRMVGGRPGMYAARGRSDATPRMRFVRPECARPRRGRGPMADQQSLLLSPSYRQHVQLWARIRASTLTLRDPGTPPRTIPDIVPRRGIRPFAPAGRGEPIP